MKENEQPIPTLFHPASQRRPNHMTYIQTHTMMHAYEQVE